MSTKVVPLWWIPLALAACLGAVAAPARAELVVLTHGDFVKVAAYQLLDDGRISLTLPSGGHLALPLGLIERIVDDEVVPEPEEPVVASTEPSLELDFRDGQPVPETPYGGLIFDAAKRFQLNPQLVAAVVKAESAFNPGALSPKGARGLMQLMPATASRFGVHPDDLYDPQRNLEAGARYLAWLHTRFAGDLVRILAAYNAGENAVARYDGVPPYRETRNYIRRIYATLGLVPSQIAGLL